MGSIYAPGCGPSRDSRAAIVELFIAVGRGLAAAHAAGIVHRDFKPENVLIDRQGRARVTDFGIARMSREGEAQAGQPELAADGAPTAGWWRSLTVTGAVLGTPSYMAPEQHQGIEADARADQFAFCVALCEAVTGLRPFRGSSSAEILDAILTRRRAAASGMPRWLRAALLRGLEPDPRDRWPGMEALLAALARRSDKRGRRWLLGGALAAGLGVLTWSTLPESQQIEACPPAHRFGWLESGLPRCASRCAPRSWRAARREPRRCSNGQSARSSIA